MTVSYRPQVAAAFEVLAEGLAPFVDQRMTATFPGTDWILEAAHRMGKRPDVVVSLSDPHFQLEVLNRWWGPTFADVIPPAGRPLIGELRTARNHWAHPDHDHPIDFDYAMRVHGQCEELLRMVGADDADRVAELLEDLRWDGVREAARAEGVSESDALMGQFADLQKQHDELQAQLEEARTQAVSASGRSRAFARQLAELQSQYAAVAGLRDRYQTLQAQLEEERRSADSAEWDTTLLQVQLSDAGQALDHLQAEATRLRDELEVTRSSIRDLDPADIPAGRRWLWLVTALITLLGMMIVIAFYVGRASAA